MMGNTCIIGKFAGPAIPLFLLTRYPRAYSKIIIFFSDPIHKRFSAHEEFLDRRDKVVSARTYFYDDEAKCDDNMNIFLQCVDAVSGMLGTKSRL